MDQVLKEARRIPEEILGKVSIAVSITSFFFLAISVCVLFSNYHVYVRLIDELSIFSMLTI